MSNKITAAITCVVSVFIYLLIPYLFYNYYIYHCVYISEYQMFTFDWVTFVAAFSIPGGFSRYVGDFLTACFAFPAMGPLILGVLIGLIGLLLTVLLRKIFSTKLYFAPPLMLALLIAILHLNLLVRISMPIMMILILALALAYCSIQQPTLRRSVGFLLLSIAYWVGAAGMLILFLILLVFEVVLFTDKKRFLFLALQLLLVIVLPLFIRLLLASTHPIPIDYAYAGDVFTAEKEMSYDRFYLVWAFPALSLLALALLHRSEKVRQWAQSKFYIGLALLVQIGLLVIIMQHGKEKYKEYVYDETFMKCDYLIKQQKWDEVVQMAYGELPLDEYSYPCVNLALIKSGKMASTLFNFPQNSGERMLIPFKNDYLTAKILTEVFYNIGAITNAQHFAFEGMISTPGGKNLYLLKRLTECAVINKEYPVARKYLYLLSKTPFERQWANDVLARLDDEKKLQALPWVAEKRAYSSLSDQVMSQDDIVQVCIPLLNTNPANPAAFDYTATTMILAKQLHLFARLYYVFKPNINVKDIPLLHQQAFAAYYDSEELPPEKWDMRYLSEEVGRQFLTFKQRVLQLQQMKKNINDPALRKEYGRTYWYYHMN